MLKCGQTGNTKYTFGLRQEQMEDEEASAPITTLIRRCSSCGEELETCSNFCPSCGNKLRK